MSFEAKYGGRCGVCDEAIRAGDRAAYIQDEIAHAECPTPIAMTDPCMQCFMVPATNGSCGCDA